MNMAIASDDGVNIASHFGKTKGFLIFNIQGARITEHYYKNNTFTGHARGLSGHGHEIDRHGPILDALKDCKVVISKGMGKKIYDNLQNAGKEIFITEEINAKVAADLYIRDQLVNRPELGCDH